MLIDLLKEKNYEKIEFKLDGIPTIDDRDFWENIPQKERLILDGEKNLNKNWGSLLYTQWRAFEDNGSRVAYEDPYFERGRAIGCLMLAECIENKGRFMDDFLNGVMLVCEQTAWGLSAHRHGSWKGIPDPEDPYLDIYAGDYGGLMALILHIFGDKIEETVRKRIKYEIRTRVIDPFLKHEDYWWFGYPRFPGDKCPINNHATWTCVNLLNSFMEADVDRETFNKGIYKIARIIDYFIDYQPEDGGCEEGAGYWGGSTGCCIQVLDMFRRYSGGLLDYFGDEKLRKMCRYFANAYISIDYVINFADCDPKINTASGYIQYLCGTCTGDDDMCNIGKELTENWLKANESIFLSGGWGAMVILRHFVLIQEILNFNSNSTMHDVVYLPHSEYLRIKHNDGNGLFLAAKGGHNNESGHNHNDVGTFIIFADKLPVLIDAGRTTYTKKTFSSERYTLWQVQSSWHNIPDVNGEMQPQGEKYHASGTVFDEGNCEFSMNLATAYPEKAAIKELNRKITFDRDNNEITLQDKFVFEKDENVVSENFMFAQKPELMENGIKLRLSEETEACMQWEAVEGLKVYFDEQEGTEHWAELWRMRLEFPSKTTSEFKCKVYQTLKK